MCRENENVTLTHQTITAPLVEDNYLREESLTKRERRALKAAQEENLRL